MTENETRSKEDRTVENAASRLLFARSSSHDPYANLAFEEAAARSLEPGERLLYLWQNERTVVVGRNQNAWAECAVEAIEADGGRIARRPSGGGAVYHDVGNLNFTFACSAADYDLGRNLEVIRRAVGSFGIDAQATGRNDVTVDGAKFSGNAFYRSHGVQVHHGTLMVGVDMGVLARYLRPDPRKLQAKGVSSVRSRVVNLADAEPRVTVDALAAALRAAFGEVFGGEVAEFDLGRVGPDELETLRRHFASWEWRLGAVRDFTDRANGRFPWGGIEFRLTVSRGVVSRAEAFSDALDAPYVERLAAVLSGTRFASADLQAALGAAVPETPGQQRMLEDCRSLFGGFTER